MPALLRVEGELPESMTMTAGWFRARARPWNDEIDAPMVRLERGGAEFLIAVTKHLHGLGAARVLSPALYEGSTRVWERSGFGPYESLVVMERALTGPPGDGAPHHVERSKRPDWDHIVAIDNAAFDGFWRMSRQGLIEAHGTNRDAQLFTVGDGPDGYALVGTQWGTAYLHRIGVRPESEGTGMGRSLLNSAITWASSRGARTMVLNVRPDNHRARAVYRKAGFSEATSGLVVLSHEAPGC